MGESLMYDTSRLLPIFSSVLGEFKKYSNNEYYFYCPFCGHHRPKLAINLGKGRWHCWKCNSAGNRLISLAKRLQVSPQQLRELKEILSDELPYIKEDTVVASLMLPEEFKPMWKPTNDLEYKHALVFLKKRGITAGDILRYGIGYCTEGTYQNRLIIPSYDRMGQLNYFVGRDYFDVSPLKYKNPPVSKNVVGFEYHINWGYEVVLCEGVLDAMAIKWNAIPLFGKTLPHEVRRRINETHVPSVCLALDSDASSDALRIANVLRNDGILVRMASLDKKDPNEIGFVDMQQIIKFSKEVTYQDIVLMKLS